MTETIRSDVDANFPRHTLVAGIDGSGKSTLLDVLSSHFSVVTIEPTVTDTAHRFRQHIANTPLTPKLIRQREMLFLGINKEHSLLIQGYIEKGENIATTGNEIVTVLSHMVMKEIVIGSGDHLSPTIAWINNDESVKPDSLYLTHAPIEVIRDRIANRQKNGDQLEKFWGFNSPFFLEQYQDAWQQALEIIAFETDVECLSIDTSSVSPEAMVALLTEKATNGLGTV